MNNYYVYILTNINNTTLYVGVTNNLGRRLYEHQHKVVDSFSSKYQLNKLVYFEISNDVEIAINREKIIKKWSRAKKEKIINKFNPNWDDLASQVYL